MEAENRKQKLKLSAQRALLGNIPKSLHSVSLDVSEYTICCRFAFVGVPTEEEKELLSCAATEIIADFSSPYTIAEEYLEGVDSGAVEYLPLLVFLRAENI